MCKKKPLQSKAQSNGKKKKRENRGKKKSARAPSKKQTKKTESDIYIYTGGYLSIFAPTKRAIAQEEYKNQENASHKREKRKLKVVLNSIIELLKERKKN